MHYLAQALDWATPAHSPPPDTSGAFESFNAQLKSFTSSLPPSTALIIFTGCSDPRPLGALNKRKAAYDGVIRAGVKSEEGERWDGEEMDRVCEGVKAGLAFFCVTRAS